MNLYERKGRNVLHTQGSPCEDGTEVGVMLPETKESQELPDTRRCKYGLSTRAFRGSVALPTPQFQISSLQNYY